MPIADVVSRTIKCDAPECDKSVVFNPQVQEEVLGLPDWIRTTRTVQLGNRASFTYCSDVCEVKGVTTGNHNVPEPKAIEEAGPGQVQQAVRGAAVAQAMRARPGDNEKKIIA